MLQQRTITQAAEVVGGYARLAKMLSVSEARVALWMAGEERPEEEKFMEAVDILVAYGSRRLALNVLHAREDRKHPRTERFPWRA